ncbi:MAG: hypothetical protein RL693_498 [Verrucomicrobiota bacterium]|jgi:hypothetical protein
MTTCDGDFTMNQVRALIMLLVVSLAGMGAWVYTAKQKQWTAEQALVKTREEIEKKAKSELDARVAEHQKELTAQSEGHQKELESLNADWEKKIETMRKEDRQRMSAAFTQFGDILEGNKKALNSISALEEKVKAGQALSKAESQDLAVMATGLSYLQKQYEKPFVEFKELETYLSKQSNTNLKTPDMRNSFFKRMFSKEFREQEREFYRTEGERRGFQDASAKFTEAYASAQKQMSALNLDFQKAIEKLGNLNQNDKDKEDLSEFFDQARKALSTHQKVLEFEPEVIKPTEIPKP